MLNSYLAKRVLAKEIHSGCSMLMYAAALMPLIQSLSTPTCDQNWYADDCACTADLSHLNEWFGKLCSMGPRYGYYPDPKKTVLIVGKEFDSKHMKNLITLVSELLGAIIFWVVLLETWKQSVSLFKAK